MIRTPGPAYVFLAHLRRDGITVREGDRVAAGQPLGRVGHSGNSDDPHLHLHLHLHLHVQDRPGPDQGRGLNPVLEHMNVELNGRTSRDAAWPVVRGLFVAPR